MKSVSLRDVLKISELSGYKEFDLFTPEMDKIVAPWLYAIGIDTNRPVQFIANIHRDLSNKVALGYRVVGESRTDREYLHSPMCDIVERIIAAGELDMSLATEMAEMMNKTINFNSINEVDDDDCYVDMDLEIEEGYLENMALISTLNQVFLDLRGTSHIQYKRK